MAVTGLPRCRQCDRFHKARSHLRFPKNGRLGMESWECRGSARTAGFGTTGRSAERPRLGDCGKAAFRGRFEDRERRDVVVSGH